MSRHGDSVTVRDTDFLGPQCSCTAVHILDAFYRKHRHGPSQLSPKSGKGQKGAIYSPHLSAPHARARLAAANDERRRLCLKALAFERFPFDCPMAANDECRNSRRREAADSASADNHTI
jgi:hypothetical protein